MSLDSWSEIPFLDRKRFLLYTHSIHPFRLLVGQCSKLAAELVVSNSSRNPSSRVALFLQSEVSCRVQVLQREARGQTCGVRRHTAREARQAVIKGYEAGRR